MPYYPRQFTRLSNFQLAWQRVLRGSNREYKRFFSHLYPPYRLAERTILKDLISQIQGGTYQPSPATRVYFPKASGVLRPISLLALNDQVVYQAIANVIADQFYRSLLPLYGRRTFGALYAGRNSRFFYRAWKKSYRDFNKALTRAHKTGKNILADFDLVSFFDLIDHKALRTVLARRVRSGELLDLLFKCLGQWTSEDPRNLKGHGIPQGPEPSAFLAAVFLDDFDRGHYGRVAYLRYVDDIRLLGKTKSGVERALLRLDLQSKRLGLVPQAQKIAVRQIADIRSELKSVPSSIAGVTPVSKGRRLTTATVSRLQRVLRASLHGRGRQTAVKDPTKLKFALYRLPASTRILRRIAPLFTSRPDLSRALGVYAARFRRSALCAGILHEALRDDPVFDAAAGGYVDALEPCAPTPEPRKFRRLVAKLPERSVERSLLLDVPAKAFLYGRTSKAAVANLISSERSPLQAGLLIQRLAIDPPRPSITATDLATPIRRLAAHPDEALSRYCVYLMLSELSLLPARPSPAGALLLRHLGVATAVLRPSLLVRFFRDFFNLAASLDWARLLGKRSHREAQRRTVTIRGFWGGNPSVFVTALDAFNDLLIQRLSAKHPTLRNAYRAMAGKNKVPDFGKWLNSPHLQRLLPTTSKILRDCHRLRVAAEIAHATERRTGRHTRPVTYSEARRIFSRMRLAYKELLSEWGRL